MELNFVFGWASNLLTCPSYPEGLCNKCAKKSLVPPGQPKLGSGGKFHFRKLDSIPGAAVQKDESIPRGRFLNFTIRVYAVHVPYRAICPQNVF